ncbi:phospholipid carrier-dependent glycosyltransferase [Mucilaginibacter corticis]|uniref:Phospholipid carrier-dependent glycosyltransferase n=1 Tax=Mucilaginibacter corticis TaxID=2597670 RepID=A0A556MFJ2_9SPHI|nr:glycosyltransferase family 39 protein [Mucilaginibacter corticis]TSJ38696.1 phospholipid carrier-dependent glycosyltransferase [Mucilaginibacter corticis]
MDNQNSAIAVKWLYLFIGLAVIVNFSGLFVPIIGPDGTLYASIAKTMALRNDYVDLYAYGADWLDKPHFPFWIAAFSFKLFGFTTWAYKLPGILFLLMGAFYTYLFGKALYNKQTGLWAVLILLTAQHIILSDNDVRAEPYLTGLIIASVYHLYKAHINNNYWQLLWGCLFAACAIMTKGMFALIPIGGAIAGHLIITRQWKQLFSLRWLIAVILVLIFIIPELYCLNHQFDQHPEKLIFDRHNVSGIRFFFWDSQFGRFFNTGPIKGHGDPTFFVHTTLWAFLPWSLLLFAAIYQFIKKGSKQVNVTEWYCVSGALLTFLLFSASKFQLPHYLNIVFPFFAITTAQYLYNVSGLKSIRAIRVTQVIVIVLLIVIVCLLHYFYQPETFTIAIGICLLILLVALLFLPQAIASDTIAKTFLRTLLVSFLINIYLNTVFYTSLLHYQAGSEAAMWINQNNHAKLPVVQMSDEFVSATNFYINGPIITAGSDKDYPQSTFMLYAAADKVKDLEGKGYKVRQLQTFQRYWVSRLKPAFLNKATREKELTQTAVVIVSR